MTSTTTTTTTTTSSTGILNDRVPTNLIDDNTTTAIIEPISPEPVTATFTLKPPPTITNKEKENTEASFTIPAANLNSSKEKDNKNVPTPQSPTTTTTTSTTLNTKTDTGDQILTGQLTLRDKRSLFDIDNASSLTLADKLRNEANKYNEVTKSTNDLSSLRTQQSSSSSSTSSSTGGGTTTTNADDLDRKYDSTPSSPLHHATTERRPSWRLKLDTGNKVCINNKLQATKNIIKNL